MSRPRMPKPGAQRGFALIEALVAVVILAIGLIGTLGLQARSYSALEDSAMRTEATLAAESLLGTIATDQANLASYAVAEKAAPGAQLKPWFDATVKRIPSAVISVTVTPATDASGSRVDIQIGWTRKGGAKANRYRVTSYVSGSKK